MQYRGPRHVAWQTVTWWRGGLPDGSEPTPQSMGTVDQYIDWFSMTVRPGPVPNDVWAETTLD
jgi:hypothetical protein